MQIAAAVVGSVGATQVIRPCCPVVSGPCPGNDRGVICSLSCTDGDTIPDFGEATCPAEHVDDSSQPGSEPVKCGHDQIVFWSGASWVHPMDMGVCDRAPV